MTGHLHFLYSLTQVAPNVYLLCSDAHQVLKQRSGMAMGQGGTVSSLLDFLPWSAVAHCCLAVASTELFIIIILLRCKLNLKNSAKEKSA